MPYLPSHDKVKLEHIVVQIIMSHLTYAGQLNYLFTELAKVYLRDRGESYAVYNEIIGALECCKLELYRRKIGEYEDSKIKSNGDVYEK